ncbi:membrane protein insertase YidC [Paenalcaligenes sp. Me52]|uniref:membrane protein insertase YidC n=1 Tax=Paenalcaligenes sp. Me52 TaxID=3392038 RepID=UPI003D2A0A72
MDIRRTLLWMIFSFSLLLLWNNWQEYNGKPSLFSSTSASETTAQATTDGAPTANGSSDASIPSAAPATASTPAELPVSPAVTPSTELVQVETNVYKLSFDPTGAQLVKAELLKYGSPDAPDQPMVLLDNSADSVYMVQSGIVGAPAGQSYPTHLTPYGLVSNTVDSANVRTLVFEAVSDGVRVVKTFTLGSDSYAIQVRHDVYNVGDVTIQPSVYLQLTRDGNNPPDSSRLYNTFTGPVVYSSEDKFQKISFSDIDKNKASYATQANNGWIGFVQHYFATAWVPPADSVRTNQVLRVSDNLYAIRTIEAVGSIAPGASQSVIADLWVGPQDQAAMGSLAEGLDLVVDYGWLTILAKPLYYLLALLHSFLGNWGWSIVALTVLIKLVFYPLSAASYRSMAKMKLVTPRLQALRAKYGDDKAKLNAAMMEMYRTEKINPLGGCLPMLVQIPVFIALYWVLLGSVEMRGAPWILWVQDLAARDPWFILPAVMMATMFLQIKLNPTPPDPMQARIMMIMPLVFGGMMFFFPAGLVLYWCVNNTLSIAQQRYIMHKLDKETAAAKR